MFFIISVEPLTKNNAEYEPTRVLSREAGVKTGIRFRYITNELDASGETFAEAIERTNYTKNECWINSFIDFYSKLFHTKEEPLSREMLLRKINKNRRNY